MFQSSQQKFGKAESATTDPIEPQKAAEAKLKDDKFVKQMKATLSPGLFELADAPKSEAIVNSCIAHCNGSTDILSKVLQSKFVAAHSAFYWVLVGSEAVKGSKVTPPLLLDLLRICEPLSEEIQDDIVDALFQRNSDKIFQRIAPSLPRIRGPTAEPSFEYHAATATGQSRQTPRGRSFAHITFEIPQFFDRLLVDQEVVLPPCLSNEAIWQLRAKAVNPSAFGSSHHRWEFELAEIRTKNPQTAATWGNRRTVKIDIKAYGGDQRNLPLEQSTTAGPFDILFYPKVRTVNLPVKDADLASFHGNKYIGPGRKLSGTVTIVDSTVCREH